MPGQSRNFLRDRKLVSESCCLPVDIGRFVVGKDVPIVKEASLLHRGRVGTRAGRRRRRGRSGGGGELLGGGLSRVQTRTEHHFSQGPNESNQFENQWHRWHGTITILAIPCKIHSGLISEA